MADDKESTAINIDAFKQRFDRIEESPVRWLKYVWAKRLEGLRGNPPKDLWSWIVFTGRVLADVRILLVLLLVVLTLVFSALGTAIKGVGWWWEKLKKEPAGAVVILLALWGLVAAIAAGVFRVIDRQTVVLISPFELTTAPPKALAVTGKTVAGLLKDELFEIIRNAQSIALVSEAKEPYGTPTQSRDAGKGPAPARSVALGEGPEISAVGIEIEGISFEKIVALYNSIRYEERHIEGDVVFTGSQEAPEPAFELLSVAQRSAPCRMVLLARVTRTGSWRTKEHSCDQNELKSAAHELAECILSDLSPNTLAMYLEKDVRVKESLTLLRKLVARDPRDPRGLLDLAAALERNKDYNGAIEEYRQALELHPKFPEQVHDRLGGVLYALGATAEAEKEYRTAIRLNGTYARAHIDLGYLLRYRGSTDEAEREFLRALAADNESADAHDGYGTLLDDEWKVEQATLEFREAARLMPKAWNYHVDLAAELEKLGRIDSAITEYREFIRQRPTDPWAHLDLSWDLLQNGQLDEAVQEIRAAQGLKEAEFPHAHAYMAAVLEARGDLKGAIKEYENAIKLRLEDAEARETNHTHFTWAECNLALVHRPGGDYKEFQEQFEKAFRECDNDEECADASKRYADALRFERDFENSKTWYETALEKKDQRDPDAFVGMGNLYDDMRDEVPAYDAFQRALLLRDDPDVHLGLASVYENAGLRPDAIREFRKAAKLSPSSGDALRGLANDLEAEGDYEQAQQVRESARAQYKSASQRKPADPFAHDDLGNVLVDMGSYPQAIQEYDEALHRWPGQYLLLNNKGSASDAWSDQPGSESHQALAIAQYQQSITSKPNFTLAHLNLANALDLEGKHQEAVAEYLAVLAYTPNDIWGHTDLGLTYDDLGDYDKAISQHRAAIQISAWLVHYVGEAFGFPEGHSNLCRALNHKGDYVQAIGECRMALNLSPGDMQSHLNLADALSNKLTRCKICWKWQLKREASAQYMEAAKEAERALHLRPDAVTYYSAGRAYEGLGRVWDAIERYESAIQWKFIYPRAHYQLARMLQEAGNTDGAAREFALAQQQDPFVSKIAP